MKPNPETLPKRAANIFINYRRGDSAGHTGRLFDRLSNRFPGRVFMDVDTIEPGIDFADVIEQAVGSCEVLIVMIGREWLFLTDASGQRRLDSPSDFVRLEIAAALERNIRIIPVLVEGTPMPRMEDLPPDLAKLTRRNAIELSDARFAFDMDRLIQTIEGVLQDRAPSALLPAMKMPVQPAPAPAVVPAGLMAGSRPWLALATLALLALVGWLGGRLGLQPSARPAVEAGSWNGPVNAAPQVDQKVSAGQPGSAEGARDETIDKSPAREPAQDPVEPRAGGSKKKGSLKNWVEGKKKRIRDRIWG